MLENKSDWTPILFGFIATQIIGTIMDFYSTKNLLNSFSYVLLINGSIWALAITLLKALTWISDKEQ